MKLTKRKINLSFSGRLAPWLRNKPFTRNFLYAYTVLVPDSERFIIRTVLKVRPLLTDDLNTQVNGLFFQEGQHAREHDKANAWMETQNYKIKLFRKIAYTLTYGILEALLSSKILLSIAAATEHLNSTLSEYFLNNLAFFSDCPPHLTAIYSWHFAEEIEHKEVVYDVFKHISGSYVLRLLGALIAGFGFLMLIPLGALVFGVQDRSLFRPRFWGDFTKQLFGRGNLLCSLISCLLVYLKPTFHPSQVPNTHLIAKGINLYNLHTGGKNDL